MTPYLLALHGPFIGSKIPLSEHETTIGRERDNSLVIADPLLSRHHCAIRHDGDNYWIHDLKSRNGIFVNGLPIGEHLLQHGDRVEIGSSLFVFALPEKELPAENSIFLEAEPLDAKITVASSMQKNEVETQYGQNELSTLLRISQSFHSMGSLKKFSEKLLEWLFLSVPTQRGTVLVVEAGKYRILSSKNRAGEDVVHVSRSIVNQTLKNNSALMVNDIRQDTSLQSSKSLLEYNPQSIICVPLMFPNRLSGVVYLDIASGSTTFTEENLQLAQAIVGIASPALKNIQDLESEREKSALLRDELFAKDAIIGESSAIRKVKEVIHKFSKTDTALLMTGESGTGKELTARAIHANSSRSEHPFITVNCTSMPDNLLESELFGHEQGAFAGALFQRKGKLQAGEGGTVFLDEIAELPLPLQAKLLRALVQQEIDPTGGTIPVQINVRFIVATNRDLQQCIENKVFREDLYYQLNATVLNLPALRQRGNDVLLLARYFANRFSRNAGKSFHGISTEAQEILGSYKWPGNVRELENAIECAMLMSSSEILLPEDLPEHILESVPYKVPAGTNYHDALQLFKKQIVLKAFEGTDKNYGEAASRLGIHLNYLYRLVRNLNLKDEI